MLQALGAERRNEVSSHPMRCFWGQDLCLGKNPTIFKIQNPDFRTAQIQKGFDLGQTQRCTKRWELGSALAPCADAL